LGDVFGGRPVVFVVGMSADKNAEEFAAVLGPVAAGAFLTRTERSPRAADPEELVRIWRRYCPQAGVVESVADALKLATQDPNDALVICITGSVFLVGDAFRAMGVLPFQQ